MGWRMPKPPNNEPLTIHYHQRRPIAEGHMKTSNAVNGTERELGCGGEFAGRTMGRLWIRKTSATGSSEPDCHCHRRPTLRLNRDKLSVRFSGKILPGFRRLAR